MGAFITNLPTEDMMTNNKKKDAYYFPHDSNAHRDPKILQLRTEYGAVGVGIFWMIIENIREQPDYRYDRGAYGALMTTLIDPHTNLEKVKSISEYCLSIGLLEKDDSAIFSLSLIERMETYDKMRSGGRRGAKARWGDNNPPYDPPHSPPYAPPYAPPYDPPYASKEKERKEKEKTVRKQPDGTLTDVTPPGKATEDSGKPKGPSDEVKELMAYYYTEYEHRFSQKYGARNFKVDSKIFSDLLNSGFSMELLMHAIDQLFTSEDPFIVNSSYTTGLFKSVIHKLTVHGIPNPRKMRFII